MLSDTRFNLRTTAEQINEAVAENPTLLMQILDKLNIEYKQRDGYLGTTCGHCEGKAILRYEGVGKIGTLFCCYNSRDYGDNGEPCDRIFFNNLIGFCRTHTKTTPKEEAMRLLQLIEKYA